MKKIYWIGLTFIFIFLINDLQAQTIKGTILDQQTGKALSYANISIYHTQSKHLLNGTISDQTGAFQICTKEPEYLIYINVIGYQVYKLKTSSKSNSILNLGEIKLKPQEKLSQEGKNPQQSIYHSITCHAL